MFRISVGAVLDLFVIENLYLGVELGLNYMTVNSKDAEITTTVAGNSITATFLGNKVSTFQTGAENVAFRLG